jgi:hypothetical protein
MKKYLVIFMIILVHLTLTPLSHAIATTNGSLTTTYAGGNGCNGTMFNIWAYTPLTITGIYQNIDTNSGSNPWVYVYYRDFSQYAGHETTPGGWMTWTAQQVANAGSGFASFIDVPDHDFTAGHYIAIYIHVEGIIHRGSLHKLVVRKLCQFRIVDWGTRHRGVWSFCGWW